MDELDRVRRQLLEAAQALEGVLFRLLGMQAVLPLSSAETSRGDLDADPPAPAEIRAVLGNCVRDYLEPLIRDLRDAAAYRPASLPADFRKASAGRLDLGRNDEATRRTLYDLVVRDNFTQRPLDDPGDVWTPSYTPEQAGLEVFWSRGRWFASWLKLEEKTDAPEEERRELLRLEEDPEHPGTLLYREV